MWIKSQLEDKLIRTREVWRKNCKIWGYRNGIVFLGKYKDIERASEVLREIEHFIENGESLDTIKVFKMPCE